MSRCNSMARVITRFSFLLSPFSSLPRVVRTGSTSLEPVNSGLKGLFFPEDFR